MQFFGQNTFMNSGKFLELSGEKILIVVDEFQNPAYFVYLLGIAKFAERNNNDVDLVFSGNNFTKKFILAMAAFEGRIESLGLVRTKVLKGIILIDRDEYSEIYKQVLSVKTVADLLDIKSGFKLLNKSLQSTICSEYIYSSDPEYPLGNLTQQIVNECDKFLYNYSVTKSMLCLKRHSRVIFLNGRYANQAAVKEAAEEFDVPWFSIEHGSSPEISVHVEPFQTQDRIAIQHFLSDSVNLLNPKDVELINRTIIEWMERQQKDKSQNPFVRGSGVGNDRRYNFCRRATIFTSSIDEEVCCPGWGSDNIRTLIKLTSLFCSELIESEILPIVVVHPNTGNRPWHDLALICKTLDQCASIVLPWEQVSSYDLAKGSHVIATWRSTIGLEMIANGININLMSESQYDIALNIPKINNQNLNFFTTFSGNQDIEMARFILYYHTHFGIPLSEFFLESELGPLLNDFGDILVKGRLRLSFQSRLSRVLVFTRGFKATPNEYSKFLLPIFGERNTNKILKLLLEIYMRRNIAA
jgi:hypothetical protein